MSEKIEGLRNIALVAHSGAGKTSLAEAMLYDSGTIKRLGRVEDGNTAMDFEPEELKRTSSINSGFHQYDWKNHTTNIIDTRTRLRRDRQLEVSKRSVVNTFRSHHVRILHERRRDLSCASRVVERLRPAA